MVMKIEVLSLRDVPIPPIPRLRNDPAGSIDPRLNLERGEFTSFCPAADNDMKNKKIIVAVFSLFCIVLKNKI